MKYEDSIFFLYEKKKYTALSPEKGDSGLNMFIKFVCVMTAGTRMADPVFLIADDTIP